MQAARSRSHIPPAPTNRRWAWLQPTLGAEAWAYRGLHTPCYRPGDRPPGPTGRPRIKSIPHMPFCTQRPVEYKMRPAYYGLYIEVSTKPAAVDAEVYIASSNNGTYKHESYVTPIENKCRERFNQISLLLIPLLIIWSTVSQQTRKDSWPQGARANASSLQ